MLPTWATSYIGVPFKANGRTLRGLDCYGVLVHVYREVFGITLNSYVADYETEAERAELASVLAGRLVHGPWSEVPRDTLRIGDGLLFRIAGEPCHVGLYLGDSRFLHVQPGIDTCSERLDGALWARRLVAAYRHEAFA
jgi:cell wall-associated NlpC family hydrolase